MSFLRKALGVVLGVLLIGAIPLSSAAAEPEGERGIIRDLIAYYFHYREEAAPEIENQLQTLSSLDPEAGETWRQIMDSWAWVNGEMPVHTGILPDGLPEDDSLCIVVLGFGLNSDGSMKQELVDRLEVALASAEKYPRSYVLCTGGETSQVRGISEAGQMEIWLLEQGLSYDRLILDPKAMSTTENAKNSLNLLWQNYPQVKHYAIVSSDYHIRWGSAVFCAMNLLRGGEKRLELVGNAACATANPDRDSMYSQAWGISILADVPFDGEYVPQLYMTEEPPETEAVPVPAVMTDEGTQEDPWQKKEPVVPVLLGLTAVLILLFVPKKRKTSGSD